MIERDAEARKAICADLISVKRRKEDDSSQNEKTRAKDPTIHRTSPLVVMKLKKD